VWPHRPVVRTWDFESQNPSSNLGGATYFLLYCLMVRILGFHPRDPGSSPGGGIYFILFDISSPSYFLFFVSDISPITGSGFFKWIIKYLHRSLGG